MFYTLRRTVSRPRSSNRTPISGIRLSDWLHRRLTYARLLAPGGVGPPTSHTPVPRGTGGGPAQTTCAALSRKFSHHQKRTHRLSFIHAPLFPSLSTAPTPS